VPSRRVGPRNSIWAGTLPFEHGYLLSEGEDFEGGIVPTAKKEDSDGDQEREDDLEHEFTLVNTV
jgi:hypothetical protein